MVQVNNTTLAISIALNMLLASALFSFINREETPDPEIVFFERLDDNLVEFDREDTVRIATFNIRTFGVTKMGKPEVVTELVEIFDRYDTVSYTHLRAHET